MEQVQTSKNFIIFLKKGIDFLENNDIITSLSERQRKIKIAELCKGSTADSDSVCLGSNPSSAATASTLTCRGILIEVWLSLVERCVRDAEVACSNPVTSTILSIHKGFDL